MRWDVDFSRNVVSNQKYSIGFYRLVGGGYSISTFRRIDGDSVHVFNDSDKFEIEDALAEVIKQSP